MSDNMIDTTTGDGWQADDAAPVEPSTTPSPAAMPQRITPPAPAQAQDDADDQGEGDDGDDLTPHDLDKQRQLRNEARNMRKRAKAAEGELDTLRSVVDGLRRGEVERLAAAELNDARDLLDRHELGDFLDEGGNVDPGKVSAAARVLVDERPHMAAPPVVTAPPTNRPIEGLTPGASPQRKAQEATTWAGALGPLVR